MHVSAHRTDSLGKQGGKGECETKGPRESKRLVFEEGGEREGPEDDRAIVNTEESILGDKPFILPNGAIYKKRVRTVMTPAQSDSLKKYFRMNNFPTTEMRQSISEALGMKPRTVQIWFQNQRQKMKSIVSEEAKAQQRRGEEVMYISAQQQRDERGLQVLAQVAWCVLSKRAS
jgi:Homeodomain